MHFYSCYVVWNRLTDDFFYHINTKYSFTKLWFQLKGFIIYYLEVVNQICGHLHRDKRFVFNFVVPLFSFDTSYEQACRFFFSKQAIYTFSSDAPGLYFQFWSLDCSFIFKFLCVFLKLICAINYVPLCFLWNTIVVWCADNVPLFQS